MGYRYTYNNQEYSVSPYVASATLDDNNQMVLGDTYQVVFGMTDSEAASCHAEGQLNQLRTARNAKLAECDWTQGEDVPAAIKSAWTTYRQALRDITNTYSSVDDVVWPEKP